MRELAAHYRHVEHRAKSLELLEEALQLASRLKSDKLQSVVREEIAQLDKPKAKDALLDKPIAKDAPGEGGKPEKVTVCCALF